MKKRKTFYYTYSLGFIMLCSLYNVQASSSPTINGSIINNININLKETLDSLNFLNREDAEAYVNSLSEEDSIRGIV